MAHREVLKHLTLFMGRVKFGNETCGADIPEGVWHAMECPDVITVTIQPGTVLPGRPKKDK